MKFIAPAAYQVGVNESFDIQIDCVGTAYLAFGDVNKFVLPFSQSQPKVTVTPAVLAGPHSINHISIHVIYQQGATPQAAYTIRVFDDTGAQIDQMGSKIDTSITLPYRDDFDLRVEVV